MNNPTNKGIAYNTVNNGRKFRIKMQVNRSNFLLISKVKSLLPSSGKLNAFVKFYNLFFYFH